MTRPPEPKVVVAVWVSVVVSVPLSVALSLTVSEVVSDSVAVMLLSVDHNVVVSVVLIVSEE